MGAGVYLAKESFPDCPLLNPNALANKYEIESPGYIADSKATGYVDIVIMRVNFWTIMSGSNGSGGTEYAVKDTTILPLDGFGVEAIRACTFMGKLGVP